MKRFTGLLFLSFLLNCQNTSNQNDDKTSKESISNMPVIENTKWQYKMTDNCKNYYTFKADSSSIYYSCETDEKYYGKYYIEEDTLYIHNFVTDKDSLLSSMESRHKSQQAKYKLIIDSNKLKHVERWTYSLEKEKWTKDNFNFSDEFLFEKVE